MKSISHTKLLLEIKILSYLILVCELSWLSTFTFPIKIKLVERKQRRCKMQIQCKLLSPGQMNFRICQISSSIISLMVDVWTLLYLQPAAPLVFTWFQSSPTALFSLFLSQSPPSPPLYYLLFSPILYFNLPKPLSSFSLKSQPPSSHHPLVLFLQF